jgi:hypothetical protein
VFAGCIPEDDSSEAAREREVLIDPSPGGTVIYRDGDGDWQLAPQVGDRYGFDLDAERYAVAVVDVERRRVDSIYTTVAEQRDVLWPSGRWWRHTR